MERHFCWCAAQIPIHQDFRTASRHPVWVAGEPAPAAYQDAIAGSKVAGTLTSILMWMWVFLLPLNQLCPSNCLTLLFLVKFTLEGKYLEEVA